MGRVKPVGDLREINLETDSDLLLYTFDEVGEFFKVTGRQVRRWCEEGNIDYVQLPGGRRIHGSQIREFIRIRSEGVA